jgi:hypothetical protein
MSLRRASAGLLAAMAVAVGGWGLCVPSAGAASSYISVQTEPNGVSPPTNVGLVSVTIAATSPLTSLDVRIYRGDGTVMLDLTLSDFVQPTNDGNGQSGTWTVNTPITTGQLALGSYSVYLSAADQGGDQVTSFFVGFLSFLNVIQYPRFMASSTSFNYDNQDVTLSGTAMLLAPDGSTTPFAGKTLNLADPAPAGVSVVTGADGSFSLTMQVTQSGAYSFYYSGDSTTESNSTAPVQLTFTTLPVHLAAALKVPHVKAGAPDSVSGTVTYVDGVSKPLAGNTVSLYPGAIASGEKPTATAVTDSSGKFTMPVPTTASTQWTLVTTETLYFPQAYDSLPMTVAQPTTITGFRATLSPFAVVHVSAKCITAKRGKARIQYAAKPGGPWHTLGTLGLFAARHCHAPPGPGVRFTGHFTAKLAAAYYRAVYVPTPDWQGAVSQTIYLHRLLTKITNFTITPHAVPAHGQITVSGRLWARGAARTWRAYGHRKVIVVFRYHHTWYRYRYEPVTSATGWFKHTFQVNASSPFFAQYNGDSAHFACASARINITMNGAAPAALARGAPLLPIALQPRRPTAGPAAIAAAHPW